MTEIKGRIVHVDPHSLAPMDEVQVLVRFRRGEIGDPKSLQDADCRLCVGVEEPDEEGGVIGEGVADMKASIERVMAARKFPLSARPDPPRAGYKYGGML